MARSAGKSLRIFKTEMKGLTEDDKAREAHQAEQAGSQSTAPPAVPPAATQPTQPTSGVQPPAPDNQTPRAE
jgi:sec-independent protein translocase protein TatA